MLFKKYCILISCPAFATRAKARLLVALNTGPSTTLRTGSKGPFFHHILHTQYFLNRYKSQNQ
jgi:hypothetical protein